MKHKEKEKEIYKHNGKSNKKDVWTQTKITAGIVFKGNTRLVKQILQLIEKDGELVYHKIDSPKNKLWIVEESTTRKVKEVR